MCGAVCVKRVCVRVLVRVCVRVALCHTNEERWGAGVETQKIVRGEIGGWGLRPVVKYHLRRGVGLIKFLENGTRPQPPTSLSYVTCDTHIHSG